MSRKAKPQGSSFHRFLEKRQNRSGFAAYCGERDRLWHSFDGKDIYHLPDEPCCYVIFFDGKLSYVGATENLLRRIAKHALWGMPEVWANAGAITIKAKFPRRYGEWAMTELRLIKRLQPPMNKRGIRSMSDLSL